MEVSPPQALLVPIECQQSLISTTKKFPGHFVPAKTNWRNFFRDYLANPLGDVPAPGFASGTSTPSTSVPPSGVTTPMALPTAVVSVVEETARRETSELGTVMRL